MAKCLKTEKASLGMRNHSLVSVKQVVSKIYRDLDLQEEGRFATFIEWIGEAIERMKVGATFVVTEKILEIKDYRAPIPCDLYAIISVSAGSNTQSHQSLPKVNTAAIDSRNNYGYKVQDGWIYYPFREGKSLVTYYGFALDTEGFVLVPNSIEYEEAFLAYVVMKLSYPKMLSGKMDPNMYQYIVSDWENKAARAMTEYMMPTPDEQEAFRRQWVRMIPQQARHRNYYRNLALAESTSKI
jgi:hypothetical protein